MRTLHAFLLLVAVAAVAAGGATAATMITGADVRNGSLTGVDIKPKSVGPAVFSGAAESSLRGPKGRRGRIGRRGPSDVFIRRRAKAHVAGRDGVITRLGLGAGRYALSAPLLLHTPVAGESQTCSLRIGTARIGAQTVATAADERVALTIAGAVTVPAAGGDVRLVCDVAGGAATVTNVSIMAIQAEEVRVTDG